MKFNERLHGFIVALSITISFTIITLFGFYSFVNWISLSGLSYMAIVGSMNSEE